MKLFSKIIVVSFSAVFSLQAFAHDINYFYRVAAQTDLANLKGCDMDAEYKSYYSVLKKGLEVTPNVNHAKIPQFLKDLDKAVAMEYNLSGYKQFDEYEAKGVSPNPSQVVRESCPDGVKTALENKAEINELIAQAKSR
ncbi:hypothetical protein ABEH28_13210 [Pseudomonas sp. Ps21-P2]|uniref:hypothetical protein n=1 Tax=Pseudomonas sp. Ps21-P2 TaxID=3080331 RepID=UPI00320A48D1